MLFGVARRMAQTLSLVAVCCGIASVGQAASLSPSGHRALHEGASDLVEIAKKKKRKSQSKSAATKALAEPSPLVAGPDDLIVNSDGADVLVKALTPAPSYRVGQSVFFEVTVARRRGARSKSVVLDMKGSGLSIQVTAPKGLKAKAMDDGSGWTVAVSGNARQKLVIEARFVASGASPPSSEARRLEVRVASDKDTTSLASGALSFAVADCATNYSQALRTILDTREAAFANVVKSASLEDAERPGSWLFPPPKRAKAAATTERRIQLPPRRECGWFVETVDFATRTSSRVCKKWSVIEIGVPPAGPVMPDIDETRAAELIKIAGDYVASRSAVRAFGKSGRLNWISNRIVTDLKGYMSQEPHPALCTGVDLMTAYFVDNSVTLRREIKAATDSLQAASGIALGRLEVVRIMLGREPEDPAETASLSLISTAQAAPAAEVGAKQLVTQAGALLLGQSGRSQLDSAQGPLAMLQRLRDSLGQDSGLGQSAEAAPYIADALTAIETVVYLEAAERRYRAVGEAIFGSISAIEKAHGDTCTCGP
ncbi:MAG: hypothetical protein R3D57_07045 [Hyphomicrobiaceae bacterium]